MKDNKRLDGKGSFSLSILSKCYYNWIESVDKLTFKEPVTKNTWQYNAFTIISTNSNKLYLINSCYNLSHHAYVKRK